MPLDPHAEAREAQASLALILASYLGASGLLITFAPGGSDAAWFAVTALIACGGL